MITIYRATLDTRNFHFEAFSADKAEAWGNLFQALVRHGKQYELPDNWMAADVPGIDVR